MKEKLLEMFDKFSGTVEEFYDFLIKEAPELANEIVALGQFRSIKLTLCTLTVAVILNIIASCIFKKRTSLPISTSLNFGKEEATFIGWIVRISSAIPLLIALGLFDITPFIAKRIYIIEYVSKLIKNE